MNTEWVFLREVFCVSVSLYVPIYSIHVCTICTCIYIHVHVCISNYICTCMYIHVHVQLQWPFNKHERVCGFVEKLRTTERPTCNVHCTGAIHIKARQSKASQSILTGLKGQNEEIGWVIKPPKLQTKTHSNTMNSIAYKCIQGKGGSRVGTD